MSYRYINIKRYKRGAKWSDGKPRMCTRCGYEYDRRKRATVTAVIKYPTLENPYQVPVAYCDEHAYRLNVGSDEEE